MSSVATARVPLDPVRLPRRTIAVVVALCAAAAAVFLRPLTLPYPTFVGACQRLLASGLPVTSRDWFCQPTSFIAHASYAFALLMVAVGLVLPCAILAATGRRWSSLLPLAVAPFLSAPVLATSWWDSGSHGNRTILIGTNVVLLAAPVVAIWSVAHGRLRRERHPGLASALVVAVPCSLASLGISLWAQRIFADHWRTVYDGAPIRFLTPAAISMALFGMMLGADRRWWPWSLVPTALLLSMALSVALVGGPELRTDWSLFGGVAPLAGIGLIWSMWRPASLWLSSRLHWMRDVAPEGAPEGSGEPPATFALHARSATLVLNTTAVALLTISLVMFRADPLPYQEGFSLPTYLGERVQAEDVRTKLDLRLAVATMDTFAVTNGTYREFDAMTGRLADPSLAWSDGHVAPDGSGTVPALTMSIEDTTGRTARVAAMSASGGVFCMERAGDGSIRYGSAEGTGEGSSAVFARAIARCGSTPWSGAAVRMLDTATLCDGVGRSNGYLICRMVQILISNTMRQTKPA